MQLCPRNLKWLLWALTRNPKEARRWNERPSWKDSHYKLEEIWDFKERHVILEKKSKLRILVFTVLMGVTIVLSDSHFFHR